VLLIALPAVEIMEKYVLYVLDVLFLLLNKTSKTCKTFGNYIGFDPASAESPPQGRVLLIALPAVEIMENMFCMF